MPQHLLFEGPDLEELLTQVRSDHGAAARIVKAERVRTGGVAGFFAKQKYELTVSVDLDVAPRAARPTASVATPPQLKRPAVRTAHVRSAEVRTAEAPAAGSVQAARAGWRPVAAGRPAPTVEDPFAVLMARADVHDGRDGGAQQVVQHVPDAAAAPARELLAARTAPAVLAESAQVIAPAQVKAPAQAGEQTFDDVLASVRAQLGMSGQQPTRVAELPAPRMVAASRDISDWRPRILTPPASPGGPMAAGAAVSVPPARRPGVLHDDRPVSEIVSEIMARVEGTTGLRGGGGDPDGHDVIAGDSVGVGTAVAPDADDSSVVEDRTVLDLRSFDLSGAGKDEADTDKADTDEAMGTDDVTDTDPIATADRASSSIVDLLASLGVPDDMAESVMAEAGAAGNSGTDVAGDLVAVVLARRLVARSLPTPSAGDVLVVAGPGADLTAHAAAVADLLGRPDVSVRSYGEVPGVRAADVLVDAAAVESAADAAAAAGAPLVLLVAVEATLAGARRGARVVRALGACGVVGVRDAAHAPGAATRWLDDLAGDDTGAGRWLALTGCTQIPGAVTTAAGADVILLDARPAGRGAWSALLVDALAERAGGGGPLG